MPRKQQREPSRQSRLRLTASNVNTRTGNTTAIPHKSGSDGRVESAQCFIAHAGYKCTKWLHLPCELARTSCGNGNFAKFEHFKHYAPYVNLPNGSHDQVD